MNRLLLTILVAFCFQARAQEKVVLEKPTVDKRIELLSIVFRLAERPEYSSKVFQLYTDRIEQHFEKHKNHELIQFTKSIIEERGIAYDAIASMSIHLDDNLELLLNVNNDVWQRDSRWTKENVEKFIPLLKQFANDSNFDDFFNENAGLYIESIKCFDSLYEQLDLDWYHTFYGKESSEIFSIILGLGNSGNYGPALDYTDGSRKVYSIIGVLQIDSTGMPKFDYNPLAFLTIIHEFNHSFVNYLVDKHIESFQESGEKMFSVIKDVLAKQAYDNWKIMMYESLVRAAVIKYVKDHDFGQQIEEFVIYLDKQNGFYWIEELVSELENYDKQRNQYPTLESYMPRLIEAYKNWAENIEYLKKVNIHFQGPIRGVFLSNNKSIVIYPTSDLDTGALKIAQDYALDVFDKFVKSVGGILLSDTAALKTDLSEYSILAFGTIESNLFLKQNASLFPFIIENQTIYADKEYTDKNIKFISCLPNPSNPEKGMLVFTGITNTVIQDIMQELINIAPESEDYCLFLNHETIIKRGVYDKNGKWKF